LLLKWLATSKRKTQTIYNLISHTIINVILFNIYVGLWFMPPVFDCNCKAINKAVGDTFMILMYVMSKCGSYNRDIDKVLCRTYCTSHMDFHRRDHTLIILLCLAKMCLLHYLFYFDLHQMEYIHYKIL
jgi:cytochrome c oxidase assembly factor CtaG